MGKFTYDTFRVEFEDRALAHLQHVIASKLRRGECFLFTWKLDVSTGGGRQAVWMHPNATITFTFHGAREPHLNGDWAHALALTANSPNGLHLIPEPAPNHHHEAPPQPMRFREASSDA